MSANHQTFGCEYSTTPYSLSEFPPMNIGNMFCSQSAIGFLLVNSIRKSPVTANSPIKPPTEMIWQILLSIEDGLDCTSTPKSDKCFDDEMERRCSQLLLLARRLFQTSQKLQSQHKNSGYDRRCLLREKGKENNVAPNLKYARSLDIVTRLHWFFFY